MRSSRVSALAGLALVLAGCTATPEAGDPGGPPTGPTVATNSPTDPSAILDAVTTLAGEPFDAATVADRPVVLWFWAPWCTICRAEAPDIAEVAAELEAADSPVALLGVPGLGEVAAMEGFVSATGTGRITHLVDADGGIWNAFDIITQPAFALISADGEVEVINGALGAEGLRAATARLTEEG